MTYGLCTAHRLVAGEECVAWSLVVMDVNGNDGQLWSYLNTLCHDE